MYQSHRLSSVNSDSRLILRLLVAVTAVSFAFSDSPYANSAKKPYHLGSPSLGICLVDTPAYDNTITHLLPGPFRKQLDSPPWRIYLYQGALLACRLGTTRVDTLYMSHCDTTRFCEDVAHPDTLTTVGEETFTTLSIIGDIVSYDLSYYGDGGAHPAYGAQYHTVQLGTRREEVQLTELFPAVDIFKVLLADTLVLHYLSDKEPDNLQDLVESLDGECDIDFRSILSSWSIYDITPDSVIVEFGLTHGCEANRGRFTSIKVVLPIPLSHADMFRRAKEAGTISTKMFHPDE